MGKEWIVYIVELVKFLLMKDLNGNRKSMFVTLGASNHTDKVREINDFYATDPIAIDKLVDAIQLPKKIWECACGTGCLYERLKYFGHDVFSSDLVDRSYREVTDFLESDNLPDECTCILTNPPYKYALEFIKHSLDLLPVNGMCVMFFQTTFLEGKRDMMNCFVRIHLSTYYNSPSECSVLRTESSKE